MRPKTNKVALSLRLPPEYLDRLDALAVIMDLDRSEVARRALRNGLDDLEKEVEFASNPLAAALIKICSMLVPGSAEAEEVTRVLRSIRSNPPGGTPQLPYPLT